MSETNGSQESLDRLGASHGASHVLLMTEHELFMKKHEAFVEERDREWERRKERWRKYDALREQDRKESAARGAALDKHIEMLVSGIGEFIRQNRQE
jgi:hypothetical protein